MENKRLTTRCVDCGTELTHINEPILQKCRCGKTTARSGEVFIATEPNGKKAQQDEMFPKSGEYPG